MSAIYEKIRALQPRRSKFNLSYDKKFDCDMGQLIPVFVKHVVPGDFLKIGVQSAIRGIPAMAPYFADLKAEFFSFFVPYRILCGKTETLSNGDKDWEIDDHYFETFLTGGRDGKITVDLPRWIPTGTSVVNDNNNGTNTDDINVTVLDNGKYSLWDYLEYPIGVIPQGAYPLDFPKRAYNLIYNTWFRDENFQDFIEVENSNIVMNCCWKKDYFTSALPFQQRGIQPTLNIGGTLPVNFYGEDHLKFVSSYLGRPYSASYFTNDDSSFYQGQITTKDSSGNLALSTSTSSLPPTGSYLSYIDFPFFKFKTPGVSSYLTANGIGLRPATDSHRRLYLSAFNEDSPLTKTGTGIAAFADGSQATGITVSQLRLALQIQKWLERNARSGFRMNEFLLAHFGVAPRDETLQYPQFIGGCKSPVIVSEVLQTAQDNSGNAGVGKLTGHSLSASVSNIGKFHVNEFGLVITLMTLRPKACYQQGIDREWLYETKYDFYFPEFAHLSEQAITQAEIFASNVESENTDLFGYQGRYNELRRSTDKTSGGMRNTLSYWHLGRIFSSKPILNQDFVKCNPSKRVFQVQDEPAWICDVYNQVTAYRPLPAYAEPSN